MRVEVLLPQWGMGITEGTVLRWLKPVGHQVAKDEQLVEIETAKATDFVHAPEAGTLIEIVADVGAVVPVGGPLGILITDNEE